ncbi:MAG TPA: AIR synthase-related protein [Armatimonadota bacterium]|nr:AIR synthase-related protein [Armatimonadota bacterium]
MALANLYVQFKQDPEAENLLKHLKGLNYRLDGLRIERVIRLEGDAGPEKLLPLFVNPLYQSVSRQSALSPSDGPIVEIGYQRAVTDPETPSIFDGAHALDVNSLEWARLSHRYQFIGATPEEARRIVRGNLFNPIVQAVIEQEHPWDSLRPHGTPDPVRQIPLAGLSDGELLKLSADNSWYAPLSQLKALQEYEAGLGRPLTDAEIEIVVQSWSDHCYHTTWRSLRLLERLQAATARINHPLVVSVFKDNAGGMRFYDGWVVLIKGETHNFPSSIATFGGIATKHGGVIRDAIGFGRGGYPIGGSTIMGTMDPRIPDSEVPGGALHPRVILLESIRATAYYCNPMGIPMMHPVYRIHPGYPKCFALGHTLGIIPEEYALKEDPKPGDAVVLFGGRTGRDGIHGATASSAEMTGETIHKDAAAVQIGHPITERKFMTAVPILRDRGCLRSVTDLGAGGISCAAGEMGSKTGVRIDLAKVPLKDESLAPWEILLSESQERMMAAVPPDEVDEALDILSRYDIEYAVVGEFTDTHKLTAYHGDTKVADIDMRFLWRACPIDRIEVREPVRDLKPARKAVPSTSEEWREAVERVLSHFHCCDQSSAGTQFDSTVQGRTVIGPYGGRNGRMPTDVFVSAPIRAKPYGVVTTLAFNPFYGELDPAGMARLSVIEAVAKAVAVGVGLDDIALCDNFYTPKIRPEVAWDLKAMVETIAELSEIFGAPFVSGKDSSSGTFKSDTGELIDVPYTLVVSTMSRMSDVRKAVTKEFKRPGNRLILLGTLDPDRLGGSVYLDAFGERGDGLSDWGNEWAKDLVVMYRRLHDLYWNENPVKSASAVAEGGVLLRLFEAAMGSGLGAAIDLSAFPAGRRDGALFSEAVGALLLEMDGSSDPADLFCGLPWIEIGRVTDSPELAIKDGNEEVLTVLVEDLIKVWGKPFAEVVR